MLELNCLRLGDPPESAFPIKIDGEKTVNHLKKMIKEKSKHAFAHLAARSLKLSQVSIPRDHIKAPLQDPTQFEPRPMDPFDRLNEYFPQQPKYRYLHILVERPPMAEPAIISTSSSFSSHDSSFLASDLTRRVQTVSALYKKLGLYGFIQVRGTPASGKTTLSLLLSDHIKKKEPGTRVIWINHWPRKVANIHYWKYLRGYGWNFHDGSVLIVDEAQLTYWDTGLWNAVFKAISAEPDRFQNRIIIFASYGCPTGAGNSGTSMKIKESQKVTLRHVDHNDGIGPIGLVFSRPEFDNYICKRYPTNRYRFDSTFLDFLFTITGGHAGAIADLICVTIAQDAYRVTKASTQLYSELYHLQKVDPRDLLRGLEEASIFRRGLPTNDQLQDPAIAHILGTVCCLNVVAAGDFSNEDQKTALRECYLNGWLHSDVIDASQKASYFFASSVHRWFVEWKLVDLRPSAPLQTTLLEFCITVVRAYSSHNLLCERVIGPGYIQRVPEAQYQDEFYRCCHVISNGSVVTFPEFGTVKGRVDFYIPANRWGVELLCEGKQLNEHCGRFSSSESYTQSLDLDDYIILDFRSDMPRKQHPSLSKLYHIVFTQSFRWVQILDNMCELVGGGDFMLLTAG